MANEIPTGYSPLVLPNVTPMLQQHGQQKVAREEEKRKWHMAEAEKNKERLTKALSFESIQGLTGEALNRHAAMVEDVTNKWAEKYAEKKGLLNSQELLELSQDKSKVDQDIANMKYNIMETEKIRQSVLSNPDAWTTESRIAFEQYVDRNDPTQSPKNILKPLFQPHLLAAKVLTETPEMSVKLSEIANKKYTKEYSNEDALAATIGLIRTNPLVLNSAKYYGTETIGQLAEYLLANHTKTKSVEDFAPSYITNPPGADVVDTQLQVRIDDFNKTVNGLAAGDAKYFSKLENTIFLDSRKTVDVKKVGNELIITGQDYDTQRIDLSSKYRQRNADFFGNIMMKSYPEYQGSKFSGAITGKKITWEEANKKYGYTTDNSTPYDRDIMLKMLPAGINRAKEFVEHVTSMVGEDGETPLFPEDLIANKGKDIVRIRNKYYKASNRKELEESLTNFLTDKARLTLGNVDVSLAPLVNAIDNENTKKVAEEVQKLTGKTVDYKGTPGKTGGGTIKIDGVPYDLRKAEDINKMLEVLNPLPIISSDEEYEKLKIGDKYQYKDKDGNLQTDVKQ